MRDGGFFQHLAWFMGCHSGEKACALDRIAEQSHHGHDDFVGYPRRNARKLSTREFSAFLGLQ